jgi:ATPase subunit of ABC transporter with duplicated ATPase domains
MLSVFIEEKSIGSKVLLKDLELNIADGEKVGFLGRNGIGKTTVFNIITGTDTDFAGKVHRSSNQTLMATSQEHHRAEGTVLEFVTQKLPHFAELENIITSYPEHMGNNLKKISIYTEALEEFSAKGYYEVENSLKRLFDAYQLDNKLLHHSFLSLSGGQKRLVELIAIQLAEPPIVLLDEPTNHMDYVAKEAFIKWLEQTKSSVVVISHDRDVLKIVDRIIELKDKRAFSYPGNYDNYLAQNAVSTTNAINEFEVSEKRIRNLKEQIEFARARSAKGGPRWVTLRERYERELDAIISNREKPNFWIDRESANALKPTATDSYHKFKSKNIRLHGTQNETAIGSLLRINNLSLGYDGVPVFADLSLALNGKERLHIVGRNGAGKTTLVRAIMSVAEGGRPTTLLQGDIDCAPNVSVSYYEQEMEAELLDKKLFEAIEHLYRSKKLPINDEQIMRDMGNYLFNPATDKDIRVKNLSGGQKARLQLIRMLIGKPNLLILDEPTNHLDLPSIEELENALLGFNGAIIYISHDSYFARNLPAKTIQL